VFATVTCTYYSALLVFLKPHSFVATMPTLDRITSRQGRHIPITWLLAVTRDVSDSVEGRGMGNKQRWAGKSQSHQVHNLGKKRKEEEEKRAKTKGRQLCSVCGCLHVDAVVINEGLMLIACSLTLKFVSLFAMMFVRVVVGP